MSLCGTEATDKISKRSYAPLIQQTFSTARGPRGFIGALDTWIMRQCQIIDPYQ